MGEATIQARRTKDAFFGSRYHDGGLSGVVGIIGQPGTGKTYLLQKMIARAKRVIFFDTVAQVGNGVRQNPMPGFDVVRGLPALIGMLRGKRRGGFRIVYQPGRGEIVQGRRRVPRAAFEFEAVCKLLCEVRNVVLAVDEIWRFCSPSWMPGPLEDVSFTGRHYGVTLLYTAQRPQLVARNLTSLSTQFKVFRVQERLDLEALRGRIPEAALAAVPSLPDRVHVARDEYQNWKIQK